MTLQSPSFEDRHRGMLAIQVSAPERLAFLRKVYSLFTMAIVIFAGTTWACCNETALGWVAPIYGYGIIGPILLMVAVGAIMRLGASRFPINLFALVGFAVLEGFLVGPLVFLVSASRGTEVVAQAAVLTAVVFAGLTLVTLTSKRDFSFLRSGLWTCLWVLIGLGLVGMLFGMDWFGWGWSVAWVILMAGFVLYDTSNIMRHYPTNMAVSAAMALFFDFVILFKHLLMLLANRD